MAIWRLRERLAIVVLGVPLALGACKKKDRDPPPAPTPDAAVTAPPPPAVPIDAALEPPADAATATLQEQIEAVRKGGGKVKIGKGGRGPDIIRGRPATERGIARIARIRAGTTWSTARG